MVVIPYLSRLDEKVFWKEIGKIGFMQISLQTPQAKYAYRLLEFSSMSPQSVTCQFHFYGSDPPCWYLLSGCSDDEWGFVKGFESATNMFSPVAHAKDEDSMKIIISASLLFQASFMLCKL